MLYHSIIYKMSLFPCSPAPAFPRPFLSQQEVEISLEDVCHTDEPKSQDQYHFAMSGKSFAVITEHFQDVLQKVMGSIPQTHSYCCCDLVVSNALLSAYLV